MAIKPTPVADRLVLRSRKMPNGCIEWIGYKGPKGYATIGMPGSNNKLVHRVSWSEFVGGDPGSLMVCHRCDNPSCINPAHLFLGTASDNLQDMARKGRQVFQKHPEKSPRGSRNAWAKLTEHQVIYIRHEYEKGAKQVDLAEEMGVTQGTISKIILRKTWVLFGDYVKVQLPDGTYELTTPYRKV